MRKIRRLILLLFVLGACFQLSGVEELFCDDPVMEAGCQDCLVCFGHSFMVLSEPMSLPAISLNGYAFSKETLRKIEIFPLHFLRPPILR